MPPVLSEPNANPGVSALRSAIKQAWLSQDKKELMKLLDAARQLNNEQGLLDPEIKICLERIEAIK